MKRALAFVATIASLTCVGRAEDVPSKPRPASTHAATLPDSRDRIELKTLAAIRADLAATSSDPDRGDAGRQLAEELIARTTPLLPRLSGEREVWLARAAASLQLDFVALGTAAGRQLMTLDAVDAGDPATDAILVALNRRGWLGGAPAVATARPRVATPVATAPVADAGAFGLPIGSAKRIVFLCDASGSMLGTLQTLVNAELRRAIDALRPDQSFGVIFFQNDEPAELRRGRLLPAIPAHQRLAYDFLGRFEMKGSTNPMPAVRAAAALAPDLIVLVSDGVFDEPEKVIAEIDRLTRGRRMRVDAVLVVATEPDNVAAKPIVEGALRTMQAIAAGHAGTCAVVRPSDMPK